MEVGRQPELFVAPQKHVQLLHAPVRQSVQRRTHDIENIPGGVDLRLKVVDHEWRSVHRHGYFAVRDKRVDVFFDGGDVGGVRAVEAAAGALKSDRASLAACLHIRRFDAVAERYGD